MLKARLHFDGDNVGIEKLAREYSLTQDVEDKLNSIPEVIDNVTTDSGTDALSARMGMRLQEQIDNLASRGRFLSVWNAATGLPETDPLESPYIYRAGDYYLVGNVSSGTNYRPHGSSYTSGVASQTVEPENISANDLYIYDGTQWGLQGSGGTQSITWGSISGTLSNQTDLQNALDEKLNFGDNLAFNDTTTVLVGRGVHSPGGDSCGHWVTIDPKGEVFTHNATTGGYNETTLGNGEIEILHSVSSTSTDYTVTIDHEKLTANDGINTQIYSFLGSNRIATLNDITAHTIPELHTSDVYYDLITTTPGTYKLVDSGKYLGYTYMIPSGVGYVEKPAGGNFTTGGNGILYFKGEVDWTYIEGGTIIRSDMRYVQGGTGSNGYEFLRLAPMAGFSAPVGPYRGQLWYDISADKLKVYDDSNNWVLVDTDEVVVSTTAPSNPTLGLLWYDSTNNVLKAYDGTNWNACGGGSAYSAGNGINIDANNEISVDTTVVATQTDIANFFDKTSDDADDIDDTNSTNKFVTASDKSTWDGKQDALTAGDGIDIAVNNEISVALETDGGLDFGAVGLEIDAYDAAKILTENTSEGITYGPSGLAIDPYHAAYELTTATNEGITYTPNGLAIDPYNAAKELTEDVTNGGITYGPDGLIIDTNIVATKSDLSDYFHKTNDDTDDIIQGNTNKFVTTSEKSTWNGKQDAFHTIASSSPANPNAGDEWFDTTNNVLKVYDGTNWNTVDTNTTYSAGNGISIDANNEISVDTSVVATQTDIANFFDKTSDDADDIDDTNSTNKFVTATEKSTWDGKQDTIAAGSNISIASDGVTISADVNTKTFPMAFATKVTDAQAAIDWVLDGNNALIDYDNRIYLLDKIENGVYYFRGVNYTHNTTNDTMVITNIEVTVVSDAVTEVHIMGENHGFLETNRNYSTPFVPTQAGHPATKQYVDNSIQSAVASLASFEVVASLPSVSSADPHTIYLLGPIGTGADKYEEWIVTESQGRSSASTITHNTVNVFAEHGDTSYVYNELHSDSNLYIGIDNVNISNSLDPDYYKQIFLFDYDGSSEYYYNYSSYEEIGNNTTMPYIGQSIYLSPAIQASCDFGTTTGSFDLYTSSSPLSYGTIKQWTKIGETSVDLTNYVTTNTAQTISAAKTFSTEPVFGTAKTTAATNDGTKFASEKQVYDVVQSVDGVIKQGVNTVTNDVQLNRSSEEKIKIGRTGDDIGVTLFEGNVNNARKTEYWNGGIDYQTARMGSPKSYTFDDNTTGIVRKQDLSNYLAKNNTTSFTPSGDYNPATKKYVDDIKPTSGAGAPSSTPTFVGQQYVDTTNDKMYVATGTSSSSDWMEVGAGSGDMLYADFNWASKTGATVTLDLNSTITPSANFTVNAPSTIKDGQMYVLRVTQGATAYTMTLGTNVTNPYGESLTMSAYTVNQFSFLAVGGNLELQPSVTVGESGAKIFYANTGDTGHEISDIGEELETWLNATGQTDDYDTFKDAVLVYDGVTYNRRNTFYTDSGYKYIYFISRNPNVQNNNNGTSKGYYSLVRFKFSYNSGWFYENDYSTSYITTTTQSFLRTDYDYSTPYTPLYNGSPATKKYVDDSIVTYTAGDGISISNQDVISASIYPSSQTGAASTVKIRVGTQSDYNSLASYDSGTLYFTTSS